MAGGRRKNPVLANPLFVALMVLSTVFVMTALGYLVAPYALGRNAEAGPGGASRALAGWIDRRGPTLLGVEFILMLATGIAAMLTEDWFTRS